MSNLGYKLGLGAIYFSGTHLIAPKSFRGEGLILMFSRVRPYDPERFQPNRGLSITPEFFETTLKRLIASGVEFIEMDDVPDRIKYPHKKRRFAAVTFDIGYNDNYRYALPILKHYDIPFTFYLSSGFIDHKANIWWEVLERVIAKQKAIAITLNGEAEFFECENRFKKNSVFKKLIEILSVSLDESEQRQTVDELGWRYKVDFAEICKDLAMTWEQVYEMSREPLGTIGSHTVNYHALARLSSDAVKTEIENGYRVLQTVTGMKPNHFAYPYGEEKDAGEREFRIVRDLGFVTGVTTRKGMLFSEHQDHLTALPRLLMSGDYQSTVYLDALLSGIPFRLLDNVKKLDIR